MIRVALGIVALVLLAIGVNDASGTWCRSCRRGFGVWGIGLCWQCWRRR